MLFAIAADSDELFETYNLAGIATRGLKGLSGWMWIVAILGFGSAASTKPAAEGRTGSNRSPTTLERLAGYVSEAVMPIYVIHQTVIVLIGFHVLQWPTSAVLKYVVLRLASFASILAIYDFAIRRLNPTRLLFGMKITRRTQPEPQTAP